MSKMETRPHITLPLRPSDMIAERASIILLLTLWALTIYNYFKLPTTVPIHFNMAGEPDGYGNKLTLFLLPLIASILHTGLTFLNKHPQVFNYPKKITADNASEQYSNATRMIRYLKLSLNLIFTLITLVTWTFFTGKSEHPYLLMLVILTILILPSVFFVYRSFKIK